MLEHEGAIFFAGGDVPLAAGVVAAGGDEPLAVGREAQGRDRAAVTAQFAGEFPLARLPALSPEPDAAAIVAGGEQVALRRERSGGNFGQCGRRAVRRPRLPEWLSQILRVRARAAGDDPIAIGRDGERAEPAGGREHGQLRAEGDVPDADRVVARAGGEALAIGEEDGARGEELVAFFELLQAIAGRDVPQAGGAVAAGGDDLLAVGREAGGEHRVVVALEHGGVEHADFLVAGEVPQPDLVVLLFLAAGEDEATVGREGDRADRVAMAAEDLRNFAGCGIPQADRVVVAAAGDELRRWARRRPSAPGRRGPNSRR